MGEGRRAVPQSHFWWQSGKMSHLGSLRLVEAWNSRWKWCIQIENSLRNYVNFTLGNRFSWPFKLTHKASGDSSPVDPRCHDGISDENSTKRQFSAKFKHWKPRVNHLTHLSHSVLLHGQKHSFFTHFWVILSVYWPTMAQMSQMIHLGFSVVNSAPDLTL